MVCNAVNRHIIIKYVSIGLVVLYQMIKGRGGANTYAMHRQEFIHVHILCFCPQ